MTRSYIYGMVDTDRPERNGSSNCSSRHAPPLARERDFKESDRIRDELAAMGVEIKDSEEGTTWEIAR